MGPSHILTPALLLLKQFGLKRGAVSNPHAPVIEKKDPISPATLARFVHATNCPARSKRNVPSENEENHYFKH